VSPELERLLEAIYARDNCEPNERDRCEKNLDQLIDDALQRLPHLRREQLLEALKDRYQQFKKARRKFISLPPKA
jgi:hypothetical protein